jgi:multisubunit Na+/H+ antiporter MnhE subunit
VTTIVLPAIGLTAIYLLVLTSLQPGDIVVGGLLGLGVAVALRPTPDARAHPAIARRLWAIAQMVGETGREMIVGSWRVVRFCLRPGTTPGLVEIPIGERSAGSIVLWGVLTGEAPDEVPVAVDHARGVLVVHVIDAADPDAVRERHERAYRRWLETVVG